MAIVDGIYPVVLTATNHNGAVNTASADLTVGSPSGQYINFAAGAEVTTPAALAISTEAGDIEAGLGVSTEVGSASPMSLSVEADISVDLVAAVETGIASIFSTDIPVSGEVNLTEATETSTASPITVSAGAPPGPTTLTASDISLIVAGVMGYVLEGGETVEQSLRLIRAEAAGKLSVSGNTVTFRDAADTKDRIVATVDPAGQRTNIVTDVT